MTMLAFALLVLLACVHAGPIVTDPLAPSRRGLFDWLTGPSVTFYPTSRPSGVKAKGTNRFGVDNYFGIRFAAPPTGSNRFGKPQDPTYDAEIDATTWGDSCRQIPFPDHPLIGSSSEDCLFLNVQVPENTAADAKLPVYVWIYGGGWIVGSQDIYDHTISIRQAVSDKLPYVYVSLNYRLGVFGWPNSKEAAEAGSANLGLRDIIKALEWVQHNIAAFGGDPSRVTIGGESAGGANVGNMLLQTDTDLFHQAIMESNAGGAPVAKTDELWQGAFDTVLQYAGCGEYVGVGGSSAMDCLKSVSSDKLFEAQTLTQLKPEYFFAVAWPFCPSVDGDLIKDYPHKLWSSGQFKQVPVLAGNNKDEGTLFSLAAQIVANDSKTGMQYFEGGTLSAEMESDLFDRLYPDVPALGSPYDTGDELWGRSSHYKQLAAALGDAFFHAERRHIMQQALSHGVTDLYAYHFEVAPILGIDKWLGVCHAWELLYVLGWPKVLAEGLDLITLGFSKLLPSLFSKFSFTDDDSTVSVSMMRYWINFIVNGDPNGLGQTEWAKYGDNSAGAMITFTKTGSGTKTDDYRGDQIGYMIQHADVFHL